MKELKISVIIYLILNLLIISWIVFNLFFRVVNALNIILAILLSFVLYFISIVIALSPIGEWIMRRQLGCKKIENIRLLKYIDPIFTEVYEKARKLDPSIPENVKLYVNDSEEPNAFATGRKTVCITKGLINMPSDQIKATFGHEFGHLAHKDTDLILIVTVGNMIITTIVTIIRVIFAILYVIFNIFCFIFRKDGLLVDILGWLTYLFVTVIINGFMYIWTKIGVLLVMKTSRSEELEADKFSFELGYGQELCRLLEVIGDPKEKNFFASLESSHPDKEQRMEHLRQLGVVIE
ncbi:M48 family metalloprotease [Sneathia sanguinegens]|uniref:M48 family metalloprotease n=1 Tax=Sneathia sanguinegens TaxID=40543 RepID=UPI0023F99217|nr:M48 family metalloprotease [Sneathia sanguinegens]